MTVPEIVFEDNQILVAIKRPGILSQADGSDTPDMLTLLKADIKVRYNKPGNVFLGLVHRLDQPVGGLMVFARTSKAAARLSEQVRTRKVDKTYLAVLQGHPRDDGGRLEDHLDKNSQTRMVSVVKAPLGKPAVLDYRVIQRMDHPNCTLVAVRLLTGRAHQIRVQFASRGLPLVGDRRYGKAKGQDPDLALFAAGLGFDHPVSKARLEFAAVPDSIAPWSLFHADDFVDPSSRF